MTIICDLCGGRVYPNASGYWICAVCGADGHYIREIINLTPHEIHEVTTGRRFPSTGSARVETTVRQVATIGGMPIVETTFGQVDGLPERTDDTIYIVSRIVKQAVLDRDDCVCPGELVRDERGQPIGCKGFSL
jgi:hypothetical protein